MSMVPVFHKTKNRDAAYHVYPEGVENNF